jgi:DNA-binding transcriptional ArsR family regulator
VQSLAVLADPTRQRIVEMLAAGALRAGEIASRFDVSAPAISQHLKVLRDANLVRVQRDRQRRIYELNPEGLAELVDWVERLRGFWRRRLDRLDSALQGVEGRRGKAVANASEGPAGKDPGKPYRRDRRDAGGTGRKTRNVRRARHE